MGDTSVGMGAAGVEDGRALQRLLDELGRLPGIGPKSAQRIAYYLLESDAEQARRLAQAVLDVKKQVHFCPVCFSYATRDTCDVCADSTRDRSMVCVVSEPRDVSAIERTGIYHGLYHVLGGVISPMQGVGPSDLKIDLLCDKLLTGAVKEVIIAISTSVEGETTLFYLMSRLKAFPDVRVTTIARGIGFGDELEYVDELTITHALLNRREI
jgi:recombination protein RecR